MKIFELGHVVFYVSNLTRSADFYKNILGFREIHRDFHTALFSSGRTHHELLLIEVGGVSSQKEIPTPGLYHVGFKIGNTDQELQDARTELINHGITIIKSADHHVTHSLYILDPDNNGLELYIDIDESWREDASKILKTPKRLNI